MSRSLSILLLCPWLPWPPHDGARIRILETLRFLSQRHRVVLVAPAYSPEQHGGVAQLSSSGATVHAVTVSDGTLARLRRLSLGIASGAPPIQAFHRNRAVAECVTRLTSENNFDIVQIEFSFLAHYLHSVHRRTRLKTVLSMHNVESLRFERELQFSAWNARRLVVLADCYLFPRWEQRVVQSFDGVVAVSEPEATWIRRHAPRAAVTTVPNGVDAEFFRPQSAATIQHAVVFTGAMDYPPNIDAVLWFADAILPVLRQSWPQLHFVVVGRRPPREILALASRPGIRITGEVEDIRPYLAEALAMVVPLRSGGGTRLKILQAMAMARPVISTTLGAEGLTVANGQHLLIADNPQQFADSLAMLVHSPESATRIAQAGRHLALAEYDWKQCLRGLEDLYQTVLSGSQP
jgi:polysaccharide biosynthesis protein PslH